ncbi:hypothetical protein WJX72_002773 [[Myrmecia] bisecta]|uniref:Dipeptidyl-peptidase V n=1 Tax=[Myrmecia] bisecta TaxID=41462 RepID=A0AAW1PVU7_9CHLO
MGSTQLFSGVCRHEPELIPIKTLLGNPKQTSPKISPDGKTIAYIAPSDKDVLNVWTRSVAGSDDRMVTNDTHRGIRQYFWSEDGKYIMYLQDVGGDEDWHVWAQGLDGSAARDLTPYEKVRAQNMLTDKRFPDQLLVGLNKRNPAVFDMYRVDIASGSLELDTENPGDVLGWTTDDNFKIRGATSMNPADGSKTLRVRDSEAAEWRDLITWPQEEEGGPVSFAKDGQSLYIQSSLGSDTTRLLRVSTADGSDVLEEVAAHPKADLGSVLLDEDTRKVLAVSFNYLRTEWTAIDPQVKADFEVLAREVPGEINVSSQSADNQTWIVRSLRDDGPSSYYLYDRKSKKATFLFDTLPELAKYQMSKMEGVVIKSRDGLDLPCYLSLPVGKEPKDLPLVLFVHGGPWARDAWGFNPTVQWFTNRGYACLQPNYRGSSGFGKSFLHAGDRQWGVGDMQHDLTDVVQWAVDQGIADPAKVAIYGGSYGGYATLAGLTFTPELYCCGVDIVGPSHVKTLFQSIPAYWAPMKQMLVIRVGDVEADDEVNRRISPLYHIDNIKVPLIIAQGANDPRVKKAEADQIFEAMKAKDLPVEYYLYTDEGHGFARPPNRLDFTSRVDQFLAKHLGGRCQAQQGDDERPAVDRRALLLAASAAALSAVLHPAKADEEFTTLYGLATPPTSYGGYGGNAKEAAKYTFLYPTGWKAQQPNKVEKGMQGIDARVVNPRAKAQGAFVVTFGRAGEDNKKFKLGDVEQTMQGFAGADYDLQDALSYASRKTNSQREVDGQVFYDYEIDGPDFHYLATITLKSGKVFALFVKSPSKTFKDDEQKLRTIVDSFKTEISEEEFAKRQKDAEELEVKLKFITEKVPTRIMNVAGSNAGAGSGEFHMYRQARRREMMRQGRIEEEAQEMQLQSEFEQKQAQLRKEEEERTAKRRAKRLKRKGKKRKSQGAAGTGSEGESEDEQPQVELD